MQYFPLFLDLKNKPVLVVGGGEVASRKIDTLLRADASVTIVSPTIDAYLHDLVKQDKCLWIQNFYSSEVVTKQYVQVWATTDNPELNHQVHKDAKKLGILVNVVDDKPYCDFITPSIINRGRIQIAISSGGASPVLIRNLREKFESVLPQNLSLLADFGASKRNSIKTEFSTVELRRKFWEAFLRSPDVERVTSRETLEQLYQKALKQNLDEQGTCTWVQYGEDVELLPLKGLRLMQEAELVLYESKCPYEFVDLCRRDAERVSFKDVVDLVNKLDDARKQNLRVCVFVPSDTQQYDLLKQGDLAISLAQTN